MSAGSILGTTLGGLAVAYAPVQFLTLLLGCVLIRRRRQDLDPSCLTECPFTRHLSRRCWRLPTGTGLITGAVGGSLVSLYVIEDQAARESGGCTDTGTQPRIGDCTDYRTTARADRGASSARCWVGVMSARASSPHPPLTGGGLRRTRKSLRQMYEYAVDRRHIERSRQLIRPRHEIS